MISRWNAKLVLACAASMLGVLCLGATWESALAQRIFGKNKVVYEDREWLVFEEGAVHLYFYPEEEELARQALRIAQDTYQEFAEWFRYEFDEPIPLILYATHHDLKQTHVIPSFVSEGTAGFTEFAKGRVALRATGNLAELRHLIRHEMVHAFMLAKLAHEMGEQKIFDYHGPPLWFIEGLAESVANDEPDAQAHMIIRDALLNDGLYPISTMWMIQGTFLMYKEGESILNFMRTQYGDDLPVLLLENWWRGRDLDELLRLELGIGLEELNERWMTYLKRLYYPQMLSRRQPHEEGSRIGKETWFDMAPSVVTLSDDGELDLVCISARNGTVSLYRLRQREGLAPDYELLVEGGRKARFESLPVLRSRMDVYAGRWVSFVAKHGGGDAIFVYDLQKRAIVDELSWPEAIEISSPDFSPDGVNIAFSALAVDGTSDLWVVNRESRALTRLTQDRYQDTHPDWHPDGTRIAFASDRDDLRQGKHSIYEIEVQAKSAIRPLVTSSFEDTEPRWSPDGEHLLFISERSGTRNLHLLENDEVYQLSNLIGGVFLPDWSKVDEAVVSVYHRGRFALYRLPVELSRPASTQLAELPNGSVPDATTSITAADGQSLPVATDYRIRLGLDFVQSVVALDPDLAYGWGASLGFTDLLGNHQLFGHLSSATDDLTFKNLNVGLSYSDLGQRWSRHFGIFRIATRPTSISARPVYSEVRTGGFAGVTYPLSLFDRLELSAVVRYLERDPSLQLPGEPGASWLWSTYLAFVHDNTLWTWQGPMRGIRYNLTFGHTIDVQDRGFDRQTIQFDYRQYHELRKDVVLATRAVARTSFGSDSQFFWLGGPNDLRGYPWFQFFGDRVLLANVELRFPLLDYVGLRFPFGPFDLPPIRGNLFNDLALVDGPVYKTGWIGSFGYSVSMTLFPPLVLRMDVVRTHDFARTSGWFVDWNLSFLF